MLIGFIVGTVVGIIATLAAGIVITNYQPRRDRDPITFSAIGAGHARTTGPESTFDFIQRRLK